MTTIDPTTAQSFSSARRSWTLGEMELKLLWRNKTALFVAVGLAPAMLLATIQLFQGLEGAELSGMLIVSLAGFALLFGNYYNLTSLTVARREERMLKRLTAGEVSRAELLVAMGLPHFLIAFVQVALVAAVLGPTVGAPRFTEPFLAILAFTAGAVICSLLAFASSGFTRSVESAQLTTMPVLLGASLFSGLIVPLHALPEQVARVAELTPLAPVVQLLQLGISGIGPDGNEAVVNAASAGRPLLVVVAWLVIGVLLTRRSMRWDVRR